MARPRAIAPALLLAASLAAQDVRVVRPKESDAVLVNPGIGFTTLNRFNGDPLNSGTTWTEGYPIPDYPFAGKLEVTGQPLTSIAYLRIYWKFIEPEQGRYDWAMLDGVLRKARERGQSLMLRIAPYGTKPDNDVPDWFRKLAGDETAKKMPAKWRTDPETPLYIRHFTKMVRELGKRYDGHPDLELVDVSIVGAWGEGEYTEKLSEPTLRALTDAYVDAFPPRPWRSSRRRRAASATRSADAPSAGASIAWGTCAASVTRAGATCSTSTRRPWPPSALPTRGRRGR